MMDKCFALKDIATAQADGGDITGAKRTFQEALNTANLITNSYYKSEALIKIAKAQAIIVKERAQCGDIQGALARASQIKEPNYKSIALSEIAKAQACCGDIQGALEITNLITDYKNVALRSIEKIKQEKEVK
jgi:hypothetical protein